MKTFVVFITLGLLFVGAASAQDNAPENLTGKTAVVVISSGSGPFSPIGGYRLAFSATSATYTVSPLSPGVLPGAGTYVYAKTGANTGRVTVTDSSIGTGVAQNLVFSSPSTATYAITALGGAQSGTLVFEGVPITVPSSDRLINMSVRAQVPAGSQTIPGFVLGASAKVLVRVAGPALAALGVSGTLANPRFSVFQGSTIIASNDDWSSTTANQAAVVDAASKSGAFAFSVGTRDAALVLDLAAGAYTAVITGDAGTSGEVLLEVYRVP